MQPDEIRREIDGNLLSPTPVVGRPGSPIVEAPDASFGPGHRAARLGQRRVGGAVEAALGQAARRGLTVDLTIGPSWPAAVPGIAPDSEAAVKELAADRHVDGGIRLAGPVPARSTPPPRA